jgi:phenylacetate-CoA ligase
MGRLESLYTKLPTWAQHAAVTTYGAYWRWLRFGPGFEDAVRDYASRDRASPEEFREWQRARVGELLSLAVRRVPYYARSWVASERDAALAGRLDGLPVLEKEPLRRDPRAFLRDDVRAWRPLIFHSSGSTGTPIASYWTVRELRRAMAVREARSARWAGVSFREPRATFSGRMVEPDPASRGPFHRYNAAEHQVYLSPFHLRAETAASYVNALERHGVRWLTGYAVSFYLLARFILQAKLRVPGLEAVITTSEKVTPEMRRVMEQAYGCRVFEEYSTVETALFASECQAGSLHVSPDVSVVEILRPDGTPCDVGEPGEVVTTCLLRDFQPLIRFRLGDVAAWSPEACACGRLMPVLREVMGRIEDVVIGPDGRELVRFHGVFVGQPHVKLGQIVQESLDRIRVRVVPADGFAEADERDIAARVRQRLGPGVTVTVECVEQIPLTAAGKFQAVISTIQRGKSTPP